MQGIISYLKGLDLSLVLGSLKFLTGPQQLFFSLAVLAIFLYGMSVGKTRALLSLLGIYIAVVLADFFPYYEWLKGVLKWQVDAYVFQMAFFLAAYIAVFIFLNNSALKGRLAAREMSFFQVAIISILQVGLLASVLISFIPQDVLPAIVARLYPYLGTRLAFFVWAAAAVVILPFLRGKRRISALGER